MAPKVRMSSVVPEDRTAEPDYRPVNRWAVFALIAGLFSVLTFAHPVFWAIPVLGLICAVIALRQITADPDYWAGQWLAKAGLALSTGVGIAGATSVVMGWMLLRHDARATAENFVSLLRAGELEKAFWMTVPPQWRREFDAATHGEEAKEAFRRFLAAGGGLFASDGPRPDIQYEEIEEYGSDGSSDYAFIRYKITGKDVDTYALIHVSTMRDPETGRKEWHVEEMLADYEPRSRKIPTAGHRH